MSLSRTLISSRVRGVLPRNTGVDIRLMYESLHNNPFSISTVSPCEATVVAHVGFNAQKPHRKFEISGFQKQIEQGGVQAQRPGGTYRE